MPTILCMQGGYMQEDVMLKLASLITVIVWLAVLLIYILLRKKREQISRAQSVADMERFKCAAVRGQVNFTRLVHKINKFGFVFVSILLVAGVASRAYLYFSVNNGANAYTGSMLFSIVNPLVLLLWLFCFGALKITNDFLKFYLTLAKRCEELGLLVN